MTDAERPLRVLHLTAGSDAGGLSRYVHDLGVAMSAAGHRVTVAGERGAWHGLFEKSPLTWVDVPLKGSPPALWRAARTLRRWLAAHPVDVIHTHYRRSTLVARRLAGGRGGPPILYTVHLSDMSLRWPRGMFTDFGDHTHVAATEALRWVVDAGRVPAGRVTLIPHGVDVTRFAAADEPARRAARAALGLRADARVAAYVGRLDYPKYVHWLLDLAAKLPAVQLLIAGDGPDEPAVRARVARERLADRVHLLGDRDPLAVYQAADALLLPSLREGFSYVCAEAMAVGVPVVRTRTAGTREMIIENVTGRSTAIEHDEFVAVAAELLAAPADRLRQMGRAAAAHVRERFTFEEQLAQTLALYRRIAKLPAS